LILFRLEPEDAVDTDLRCCVVAIFWQKR
jgi:hypothetical protein